MAVLYALLLLVLAGCSEDTSQRVSGYIEGTYIDYSSPVAGRLVERPGYDGEVIVAGDVLFVLSSSPEAEQFESVVAEVEQANWQLKNLEKGLRSDDLAYLQANVDSAEADVSYWETYLLRLEGLSQESSVSQDELDQAKQSLEKAKFGLAGARAKLKSGKLGERSDLVLAQRALVKALKAKEKELMWYLQQKQLTIDFNARVKKIYYELGEWVPAYTAILTVEDISRREVIFYLNQEQLARVAMGDTITVYAANGDSVDAKVVFISDHAEYTPPVVYTTEQGELYRFMVKAELQSSTYLHPGQPVTVEL